MITMKTLTKSEMEKMSAQRLLTYYKKFRQGNPHWGDEAEYCAVYCECESCQDLRKYDAIVVDIKEVLNKKDHVHRKKDHVKRKKEKYGIHLDKVKISKLSDNNLRNLFIILTCQRNRLQPDSVPRSLYKFVKQGEKFRVELSKQLKQLEKESEYREILGMDT